MPHPFPLFIGGLSGSGATKLADQLGTQANYAPAYDADFVPRLLWIAQVYRGQKRADAIARTMSDAVAYASHCARSLQSAFEHGPRHLNLDQAWLAPRTAHLIDMLDMGMGAFAMREFLVDVLDRHAEADGKTRWACKSPSLHHVIPQLLMVFPKMKFIHVVCDEDRTGLHLERPRYNTQQAQADRFAQTHPHQYARIQRQDLQTQMPGVVGGVVRWCGDKQMSPPVLLKAA